MAGLAGLAGLSAFAKELNKTIKIESPNSNVEEKSLKRTSDEIFPGSQEKVACVELASKQSKVEVKLENSAGNKRENSAGNKSCIPGIDVHSDSESSHEGEDETTKDTNNSDGNPNSAEKEEEKEKVGDDDDEDDELLAIYGLSKKTLSDGKDKMEDDKDKEAEAQKAEEERLRAEEERTKQEEISKREAEERAKKEREKAKKHFKIIQFMFKSGAKLKVKAVVMASAATLYHKYFEVYDTDTYDPYLIGTTALYLGHRIEEETIKVRDVINVCHRTLHPDEPPLDMGPEFSAIREGVLTCELLMMRVLNFRVTFNHPHRYMLHYLKALYNWCGPHITERVPIAQTAWTILSDCYHGKVCMQHHPADMATSVIYMATQCHGIEVPYTHQGRRHWYQVFCENITLVKIRKIINEIFEIYDLEDRDEKQS